MRRLFPLALISSLWIPFSLLAVVAVEVGRMQPASALVEQLHLADCQLPCWIGITPGETSAAEVNVRLMDTFQSRNSALSSSVSQYQWFTIIPLTQPPTPGTGMPIRFSVNTNHIEEIRIPAVFANGRPHWAMPLLGDVVSLLGEPTCVDPRAIQGWSMFYEFDTTVIEIGLLNREQVSWRQPVYFMSVRQADLPYPLSGCGVDGERLPKWAGLMRSRHYLRRG